MYEVDTNGTIIWGPYNADSQKAFRYECEHPAISALEPYMNSTATTSCFSTSVQDSKRDLIVMFPNPTNGLVKIDLPHDSRELYLKVHNSIGQEILSYENLNNTEIKEIDLSNFSQGFYHFSIFENNNKLSSQKISLVK